jgi:hypothetical protein
MVDVVTNHNGWAGSSSTVDYGRFNPFNHESHYHTFCEVNDYSNQTNVEDCWLGDSNVELVDVRTDDPNIASIYQAWISGLISNYSSKFVCPTFQDFPRNHTNRYFIRRRTISSHTIGRILCEYFSCLLLRVDIPFQG